MIRFCDNEVSCVQYNELNRKMILNYFFQNHMNEIVCVIDQQGKYKGKISYYSLINTNDVFESIQEDYVILDSKIWQAARRYFANYQNALNEHVLLPVVNKSGELLCFAYEDYDANREIRMLSELIENTKAMQFTDIYSQYECVKIFDFNELAYFFADYLKKQNIPVQVVGDLWNGFIETTEFNGLNYKCMNIYAEGVYPKKADWMDNLLYSVSVEFECIDHIYETNVKNSIFRDAREETFDFLNWLKDQKEVIILGSERESQDVYDFLIANNIDICCFVNDNYGERSHKLFGKKILSSLEARNKYRNPVFLQCRDKHSAWGFGGTDYYDYIGYKRNYSFFLVRDYVNVGKNNLVNILKDKNIVLMGDADLCTYLYDYFVHGKIAVKGYLNIETLSLKQEIMPEMKLRDIESNIVCLIVFPEFHQKDAKRKCDEKKKKFSDALKEHGADDYTDYFSYISSMIAIESGKRGNLKNKLLIPQRVILGSIEFHCGNEFFRELLDGHPSILMLNYCNINDNLFLICIRLAMENSRNVLSVFKQIYEEKVEWTGILHNPSAFYGKMKQLLEMGETFTSQELFVMFHIALAYMGGKDVQVKDINNIVIYWEPHSLNRTDVENFTEWLGTPDLKCDIIRVVRNIIMRNGKIKRYIKNGERIEAYMTALHYPEIEELNYRYSRRFIIKFEDLKCDPKGTLLKICEQWGIQWSETFLVKACDGKKITKNIEMRPVYNLNEKLFTEYDRLKMMIISAPWQSKYGYPYEKIRQFSRRELQDMFQKKFKFEDMLNQCEKGTLEQEFRIGLNQTIRDNLQRVRMIETLSEGNILKDAKDRSGSDR